MTLLLDPLKTNDHFVIGPSGNNFTIQPGQKNLACQPILEGLFRSLAIGEFWHIHLSKIFPRKNFTKVIPDKMNSERKGN